MAVNDIIEIPHLNCFAVAYKMEDENKWVYVYENDSLKTASKLKVGRTGGQKIHYNK